MSVYEVKSKDIENLKLRFEYFSDGTIKRFELSEPVSAEIFDKLAVAVQHSERDLLSLYSSRPDLITRINEALTFEDFWKKYDLKTHRKVAQDAWAKLSPSEKQAAYDGIDKYNNELRMRPGIAKLYPKTYLRQQKWRDYDSD